MNAIHRKHVYSNKSIPHYVNDAEEATVRYRDADGNWQYMYARRVEDFLAWGGDWISNREPQQRVAKKWMDIQ